MTTPSTTVPQKTSGFWYDDETHTYGCGTDLYWSVTQVLSISGRLDDAWFTEDACERGRLVHQACEAIDRGLVPDVLTSLKPYVDGYLRFLESCQPVWDHVEVPFWNPRLRLAGRPDRLGVLFGRPVIVELKTGSRAQWHALQTAGYQILRGLGDRYVVYLPGDGTFKVHPCPDSQDVMTFATLRQEVARRAKGA